MLKVDPLDKAKLIERADRGVITGNKKLFRAKLGIIADFTKEEEKFARLFNEDSVSGSSAPSTLRRNSSVFLPNASASS